MIPPTVYADSVKALMARAVAIDSALQCYNGDNIHWTISSLGAGLLLMTGFFIGIGVMMLFLLWRK